MDGYRSGELPYLFIFDSLKRFPELNSRNIAISLFHSSYERGCQEIASLGESLFVLTLTFPQGKCRSPADLPTPSGVRIHSSFVIGSCLLPIRNL